MSQICETLEGGCSCGKVRYEVSGNPMVVHACHCSRCQRQTGGPHVTNALFEAQKIQHISGELEVINTDSPSGKGQLITRCASCKVALWSNYHFTGLMERVRFLRVGTLDNPAAMPPDVHIYTSTKQPWYQIPQGIPAVPEFYDVREVWSEQSMQRFKALKQAQAEQQNKLDGE